MTEPKPLDPELQRIVDRTVQSPLAVFYVDGVPVVANDVRADGEWCPVCKTYHTNPGEKTDAGSLTRPCPLLAHGDPRNRA